MIFTVGLTGGIGCGKSRAADLFAELGATVVDTDDISRELTGPGGGAVPAIQQAFGSSYVQGDGSMNRAAMRTLVFGNPQAKARLEAILHPLIRARARSLLEQAKSPYAIIVVPLLLETGWIATSRTRSRASSREAASPRTKCGRSWQRRSTGRCASSTPTTC
jgi:dephospho-CoA kinase